MFAIIVPKKCRISAIALKDCSFNQDTQSRFLANVLPTVVLRNFTKTYFVNSTSESSRGNEVHCHVIFYILECNLIHEPHSGVRFAK